jgi:hypothetical protein
LVSKNDELPRHQDQNNFHQDGSTEVGDSPRARAQHGRKETDIDVAAFNDGNRNAAGDRKCSDQRTGIANEVDWACKEKAKQTVRHRHHCKAKQSAKANDG